MEAERCRYRGTVNVIVRARAGGVKGPRAGGTEADGPVLALKQSNRMGDTGKRNFPISPLWDSRERREEMGGQIVREKRAKSRP